MTYCVNLNNTTHGFHHRNIIIIMFMLVNITLPDFLHVFY